MSAMSRSLLLFLALGFSLSFSSCLEDQCLATRQYIVYQPVYAKMKEYREAIQAESPRAIKNAGAIYVYGKYLFINDQKEGIHIVDNTDPSNPAPIAFLNIPGNFSLAVRNNLLYADNYVDLVVIDISNPEAVQYVGRTENVFPAYGFDEDLGFLVYYEQGPETMEVSCSEGYFRDDIFWLESGDFAVLDAAFNGSKNTTSPDGVSSSVSGLSGSLARFNIVDHYLYSVSTNDLHIFDLSEPVPAERAAQVSIGWGIETIFPYQDKLFIGSNHGMYIFDNSNPLNPIQQSYFQHARACDPVFVEGNLAYVTLRDGNECDGFNNQLDVIDISNLDNPQLLISHPMQNPRGLSVFDERLYLCEGRFGFKVFDVSNWRTIGQNQKAGVDNFFANDVIGIPGRNLAIVVGEDGLYQFDITDRDAPHLLSVLATAGR